MVHDLAMVSYYTEVNFLTFECFYYCTLFNYHAIFDNNKFFDYCTDGFFHYG